MSTESQGFDPYTAVLADLKAKRDQIDQAIQLLEVIRSAAIPSAAQGIPLPMPPTATESPGDLLGMTIPDAAKKILAARRRTLGNAEIVAALKAGGLHMTSADPINTVGSVLTRRFNQVGDIVRVGRGIWGLAEWYPNRNFKKQKGEPNGVGEKGDEPKTTETSET